LFHICPFILRMHAPVLALLDLFPTGVPLEPQLGNLFLHRRGESSIENFALLGCMDFCKLLPPMLVPLLSTFECRNLASL
jgi:hypothetical protein